MAWLKRIDLATASASREELNPVGELVIERRPRNPNPLALRKVSGAVRIFADASGKWFASPAAFSNPMTATSALHAPVASPAAQPLSHGATLDAGDSGYVFLEYAEHREPSLEAAALASSEGVERWLGWLDERGDPFAAPLRAMQAGHEFTTRERWWLEGINRGMKTVGATFEMSGGFLRRAELRSGTLPLDLHILHALTLRASLGLEELTVHINEFLPAATWVAFARSPFLARAPWPASLRVLRIWAGLDLKSLATRECTDEMRKTIPNIPIGD